jgi:endonuclease YncB( thermonuclease family)
MYKNDPNIIGWRDQLKRIGIITVGLFVLINAVLMLATVANAQSKSRPLKHPPFNTAAKPIYMRCESPRVVDGDTLHCASGYHIRLLGLQAPEMKCRERIECVPGDASAARDSLALGMQQGLLTFQYIRRDNRNRPVVIARAGSLNLSCWQLSRTDAILKFDHRRRTEKECGVKPGTNQPANPPTTSPSQ